MKSTLRENIRADLTAMEEVGGEGSVAMLCSLQSRTILVRGQGAPRIQGKADAMARETLSHLEDGIAEALFASAEAAGKTIVARKLTGPDGALGVVRAPGCEEAVVLNTPTTPASGQIASVADGLFERLLADEAKVA